MKLIIDIPEMAYEAFKEWHKNKVATVEQSLIANGIPYEERPQGKWLIEGGTTLHYACSECGCAGDEWDKFCKHCGASMRGEK